MKLLRSSGKRETIAEWSAEMHRMSINLRELAHKLKLMTAIQADATKCNDEISNSLNCEELGPVSPCERANANAPLEDWLHRA